MASEIRQGLNIIEAAEATDGLEHFVMQSMHRGGQPPLDETVLAPIHHRAKWELEDALSGSSLPWSVLRQPTYLVFILFAHPTHLSHMSHPTFPISHILILFFRRTLRMMRMRPRARS